jgi:hypothetical protein
VVTGAGAGTLSGDAESIVHSPEPSDIGAADVPRGRTLQQPRTGSPKYSSSVRPSSRGRKFLRQYQSSYSASRSLLVISAHYIQRRFGCRQPWAARAHRTGWR